VLVCAATGKADAPRDLTVELSVRARVGYGGGEFTVSEGSVFFAEKSGRIYRQSLASGPARPVTPAFGYAASPAVSHDGRWLMYVHSYEEQDVIAIVDSEGQQWPQRLSQGHDFYMQPRWHPHGTHVAWVAWDHPNMPWDGTLLYLATLHKNDQGTPVIASQQVIAGGKDVAIFQPEFSPDGRWLSYISDESGWSNIYLYDLEQGTHQAVTAVEAEHGQPAWVQGMRTYGWSHEGSHIFFVRNEQGVASFYAQQIASKKEPGPATATSREARLRKISTLFSETVAAPQEKTVGQPTEPVQSGEKRVSEFQAEEPGHAVRIAGLEAYTWFAQPAVSPTTDAFAVIASSSTQPSHLLMKVPWYRLRPSFVTITERVLRRTGGDTIDPAVLPEAQPVAWKSTNGTEVYGMLYLPRAASSGVPNGSQGNGHMGKEEESQPAPDSARLPSPSASLPPAIIKIHGGPTSQAVASYQPDAQFFATRGYAVLLLNYRGSTGYGRAYMNALREQWGVYDVEDAVDAARYLAEQGLADKNRMVIMGGSSGGYTVLEALCRAPGMFKAGICLYGVSNLLTLVADTHKFEERYLDSLIGPLPETADRYRERSPVFHAHLLNDPVAIFQGTEDRVVPPSQSEEIVGSLRNRGITHEYHVYEGEGHGWRKSETIETFYQAVETFLRTYVIFA
jgi:dipeptidyl aminopeptidase/acylaminoacyl peptidase